MDAIIFSHRLRRMLNGNEETLLLEDGAKDKIQKLYAEIETMSSFHIDLEDPMSNVLTCQGIEDIKKQIWNFVRESEKAIDTFIVQTKNESSCSRNKNQEQLFHALQELNTNMADPIIAKIDKVYANQPKFKIVRSVQAQTEQTCSGMIRRERDVIMVEQHWMVGRQDQMAELIDQLIEGELMLTAIAIVGRSGLGKSTLAAEAYNNVYVQNYFDSRTWIHIPNNLSNPDEILDLILKSIMPVTGHRETIANNRNSKKTAFANYLRKKRYLFVLDNAWTSRLPELRQIFPDEDNGSRLLLTTVMLGRFKSRVLNLRKLNKKESWEMLIDRFLKRRKCPLEMEEAQRLMEAYCLSQPLSVLLFGGLLLDEDKIEVAILNMELLISRFESRNQPQVFNVHSISECSYHHLPHHLKKSFLYFSVFPNGFDVSTRELYWLWIAEGVTADNREDIAEECLESLIDRGLVQAVSRSCDGRIKKCSVMDFSRDSLVRRAENENFLYNRRDTRESLKSQRRFTSHSDPTKYSRSKISAPYLQSLLCITSESGGLTKDKALDAFQNCNSLRVLDLRSLILKHWSIGIENFHFLRYLRLNAPSLTSIPLSLCNLLNLETLDIPSSFIDQTPDDIWNMQKLRHLNFGFIRLPENPPQNCSPLQYLNFLSVLCPSSCSKDVFRMIPNMKKLQVRGDLSSYHSLISSNIAELSCLESLKMVRVGTMSQPSSICLCDYRFPLSSA